MLQQIPQRHDRPRGRPRDAATEELRFWLTGGGSVAENAKLMETLRVRREENPADNENLTDEQRQEKNDLMDVKKKRRTENLARRVYKGKGKRRKPDVPKSK